MKVLVLLLLSFVFITVNASPVLPADSVIRITSKSNTTYSINDKNYKQLVSSTSDRLAHASIDNQMPAGTYSIKVEFLVNADGVVNSTHTKAGTDQALKQIIENSFINKRFTEAGKAAHQFSHTFTFIIL